jgi:hypothetical protein
MAGSPLPLDKPKRFGNTVFAMTNAQAIALPHAAIVRHAKSGKLYRVIEVYTQTVTIGSSSRRFSSNPYAEASVGVVGQRNGRDFGPYRSLAVSKIEQA